MNGADAVGLGEKSLISNPLARVRNFDPRREGEIKGKGRYEMVIRRRVAVSNPHRPKKRKRKNPKKLSAKQIKFFGTKRQRAALKAKRRKKVTKNPKTRVRTRVVVKKVYVKAKTKKRNPRRRVKVAKRRRRSNPQIISLGLLNPSKGRVTVKKAHRRKARRRVSNPKRRVVVKKSYHAKGHRHHRRRTNPGNILGNGKRVLGALGGFAAMKIARGFVPASLASGSQAMSVAIDFGLAIGIGMLAKKFAPGSAEDVQLGALITASNTAINTFFPSLAAYTGMSGYGMGIYQQAKFAVPENPITRGYVPPAPPPKGGVQGLVQGRGF